MVVLEYYGTMLSLKIDSINLLIIRYFLQLIDSPRVSCPQHFKAQS